MKPNKKSSPDNKFSTILYYDDETFHIVITNNGTIETSNVYTMDGDLGQVWNVMNSNKSTLVADAAKAKNFRIFKDKKVLNFPIDPLNYTGTPLYGDTIYLLIDDTLYATIMLRNGSINADTVYKISTGLAVENITRATAVDGYIAIVCDKKIKLFQFINAQLTEKATYPQFKDIEDTAVARNGMRIHKLKSGKKFKIISTMPSTDWSPYSEGASRKSHLYDLEYNDIDILEAGYGNVVIKVYNGDNFKYFVSTGTINNFDFYEIFNHTSLNCKNIVETDKYLLMMNDDDQTMYASPKGSDYRALRGKIEIGEGGKLVGLVIRDYNAEFTGEGYQIMQLIETNSTLLSYFKLQLSIITITCTPMTSLYAFALSEESFKISFTVIGVSDAYAHIPEIRYTFNVHYVYSYGIIGTIYWIWVFSLFAVVILIFGIRITRLGSKRNLMTRNLAILSRDAQANLPIYSLVSKMIDHPEEIQMKIDKKLRKKKRQLREDMKKAQEENAD